MELCERNSSVCDDDQINVVASTTSIATKTIEWKEHKEFLANGVRDFFLQEYDMDTNVTFRGEIFKVHRLILAVFLPTFKRSVDVASMSRLANASVESNGNNNNNNMNMSANLRELNLDCVADRTEDVRALIEFVYTGKMTVSENRLDHLSRLAEDLSFEGLAKALGECEPQEVDVPEVGVQSESNGKSGGVKLERDSTTSNYDDDGAADGDDDNDDDDDDEGEEEEEEGEEEDEEEDEDEEEEVMDDDNGSEYHPTSDGEEDSDDGKVVRRVARATSRANTHRREQAALDRYCERIFQTLRHEQKRTASSSSTSTSKGPTPGTSSAHITASGGGGGNSNNNNKGSRKQSQPQRKFNLSNKTLVRTVTDDDLPNCPNCKKRFLTTRSLRRHLKNCGEQTQYTCRYCEYLAETRNILRRHMYDAHRREMAAERKSRVNHIKCTEPQCTFACDDQLKLKLHHRRMHTADKKYKCHECEYGAIRQSELTNHVTMCHLKQRNFMCDHCGSLYASRSGLYSHVRAAHEGYKHYKCEFCHKEFNTSKCYNVHIQTKHNVGGEVEMHVCHICGKSYNRRWNLQLHTRRVHKISLESRVKVYAPRRKESDGGGSEAGGGGGDVQGQSGTDRNDGTTISSSPPPPPSSSQQHQQQVRGPQIDTMSTMNANANAHIRPVDHELLEAIRSTVMPNAASSWAAVNMHHQNQFMSQ